MGGAQTSKNSAVFTEIESEFWAGIGNSNGFSAQNQVIFKKQKKKKVFTEIKIDFSAEIGNSNDFSAQNQVVTKKRSSPKLRVIFQPKSEIRTIFPPKIRWPPKKKKKVFTKIESGFSAETVSFTVTLLFNYCYVRNY